MGCILPLIWNKRDFDLLHNEVENCVWDKSFVGKKKVNCICGWAVYKFLQFLATSNSVVTLHLWPNAVERDQNAKPCIKHKHNKTQTQFILQPLGKRCNYWYSGTLTSVVTLDFHSVSLDCAAVSLDPGESHGHLSTRVIFSLRRMCNGRAALGR